jgi:hypothetical protein
MRKFQSAGRVLLRGREWEDTHSTEAGDVVCGRKKSGVMMHNIYGVGE